MHCNLATESLEDLFLLLSVGLRASIISQFHNAMRNKNMYSVKDGLWIPTYAGKTMFAGVGSSIASVCFVVIIFLNIVSGASPSQRSFLYHCLVFIILCSSGYQIMWNQQRKWLSFISKCFSILVR